MLAWVTSMLTSPDMYTVLVHIVLELTETFALVSGSVNENFGADDVSERQEHLHELSIPKLLRKVIDEEITALGARDGTSYNLEKKAASCNETFFAFLHVKSFTNARIGYCRRVR